ncbi:MAG: ABC transporter permease [Clostridiales bacterium]|nr:ABC transporter permease [Bacillota bacterium]NLL54930.1 ABC transporter permease [Clostridiales bacterium]
MNTKKLKSVLSHYGIIFVLVLLIIVFASLSNRFLMPNNIFNILRQSSIVGIISVGMTFVMVTGGIDLSCGSVVGASAVGAALLMTAETPWNPVWACLLMLLFGLLMGLANAFFIAQLKVPPFIATLGTMTSVRGIAYIITGGLPVFGFNRAFTVIGQGYVSIVPIPVIIMAVVFLFGIIMLNKTRLGRHIYGVGGNEEAARLSGVNVKKVKYLVYGISGFMSSLAGVVLLARVNSGQPNAGTGYEMDVITGVVLGGVSMSGGQGRLIMVVVGVLIMGILTNGMTMLTINEYVQQFIKGLVLIGAVALDSLIKEQRSTQTVEEKNA